MGKSKLFVLINILLLTACAAAFSGPGSGTDANPYVITTVEQLQEMRNDLTAGLLKKSP